MQLKLAVYNMEWMKDLFHKDGSPKRWDSPDEKTRRHGERSAYLAEVIRVIDPDILCIVEGPNTLKDQSITASRQLEAWCDLHGLDSDYKAVHGISSSGLQELCALYKSSKVRLFHDPENDKRRNPFNLPFLVDTVESLIKEQYKHYRPPFEISVCEPGSEGIERARIIVAHTKSKGIFDAVDWARFEQLSERNRRKLYAECYSIRERCDQYFDVNPAQKVIVCGDINDGFGVDYYERRFQRSAVEILLGNVWDPAKILNHILPKPKLGKYGWKPSSSRFKDRITGDTFNVLIDHILVSQNVVTSSGIVWNPYMEDTPPQVESIKKALKKGSDHFPVSVDVIL